MTTEFRRKSTKFVQIPANSGVLGWRNPPQAHTHTCITAPSGGAFSALTKDLAEAAPSTRVRIRARFGQLRWRSQQFRRRRTTLRAQLRPKSPILSKFVPMAQIWSNSGQTRPTWAESGPIRATPRATFDRNRSNAAEIGPNLAKLGPQGDATIKIRLVGECGFRTGRWTGRWPPQVQRGAHVFGRPWGCQP